MVVTDLHKESSVYVRTCVYLCECNTYLICFCFLKQDMSEPLNHVMSIMLTFDNCLHLAPGLPATDTSSEFAVSLETVLAGHENWVYGVHWQPPLYKGRPFMHILLLSVYRCVSVEHLQSGSA